MIITQRLLTLRDGGTDIPVAVDIHAPVRLSDTEWRCNYAIGWPDDKAERWSSGVDAVQALQLAMMMIGAELYASDHHRDGRLFWDRPGNGYGFPVGNNIRDLLVGDDRKYL